MAKHNNDYSSYDDIEVENLTGEVYPSVDEARLASVMDEMETEEEEELAEFIHLKEKRQLTKEEKEKADKARRKALSEYKSSSEQLYSALIAQPASQIVAQMKMLMADWPKNSFPSNSDSFQRDLTGALFYLGGRREAPEAAREFALVEINNRLENYARSQIYSYYSTYAGNKDFVDDAVSEAKMNLISVLHTYNPEKGMPTTFIKASFLAAVRVVQSQHSFGMTPSSHSRELIKNISKIRQQLNAEGIEPSADNIRDRLRENGVTDISSRIIAKTIDQMDKGIVVPLDSDDMKEIADTKNPTPEKALLDKERRSNLRKFINDNLTKEEKRVASYLQYLREHGLPEKKQESAEKLGYTIAEYNRITDSMRKRLFIAAESGAYGSELKARYGHRNDAKSTSLTFAIDDSYSDAAEEMLNSIEVIDLPIRADGFTKTMDEKFINDGANIDNPGKIKSIRIGSETTILNRESPAR